MALLCADDSGRKDRQPHRIGLRLAALAGMGVPHRLAGDETGMVRAVFGGDMSELQTAYDEAFQAMFDGGNVTGSTARNLLDVLIAAARLEAWQECVIMDGQTYPLEDIASRLLDKLAAANAAKALLGEQG